MKKKPILILFCALSWIFSAQIPLYAQDFKNFAQKIIDNNPILRSNLETIESSEQSLSYGARNFQPLVNLYYNNNLTNNNFEKNGKKYPETYHNDEVGIALKQNLFEGGQSFNNSNIAKLEGQISQMQYLASRQNLLLNALNIYSDYLRAVIIYNLQQENIARITQSYNSATARLAVGEITKTDVALSSSRLEKANADYIAAKGNLQNTEVAFMRMFGEKPNHQLAKLRMNDPYTQSRLTIDSLNEQALNYQISYKIIQLNRQKLQLLFQNAKAASLPTIDLTASVKQNTNTAKSVDGQTRAAVVGLSLSTPIYAQGFVFNGVRAVAASLRAIDWTLNDERQKIQENVQKSYNNYITAQASVGAAESGLQAAKIAFEGIKLESEIGNRTILDELDVKQELLNAELALENAKINESLAYYSLLAQITDLKDVFNLHDKFSLKSEFNLNQGYMQPIYEIYDNFLNE